MSRASPPVQDIAIFVAVAQNGGFTRAAEQLGTTKSNVGKAVQRLEARLGTRLLQRTTRIVQLTEDGRIYLEAARAALGGLEEAEAILASRQEVPVGRVRIDIAASLGMAIMPTLPELRANYPRLTLELSLSDRQSDPLKDGWDIVVRIGGLAAGGDMTVRKLCDLRNGLYSSPHYLAQRPAIRSVEDLREQDGVLYRTHSGQLRPWLVKGAEQPIELLPRTTVIAHDGRTMIDALRAGLGIGQLFDRVAAPFVASGELVPVLPAFDVLALPVHALIPAGRRMPPKTRVVLEHLSTVLRAAD